MSRKYFGTDGIRGRVGEYPITADFVMKLGWAAGRVFASRAGSERKLILVGKDTRISGYMFESAMQAGLIAAGVDVGLLGPMPTPAIAYLTRTFNAQADRYFNNLKSSGHGSVFEHANFSFLLYGISRSVTHEIVRHRAWARWTFPIWYYVSVTGVVRITRYQRPIGTVTVCVRRNTPPS